MTAKASYAADVRFVAGRLALFFILALMGIGQARATTAGVFQLVVGDVRVVLAAGSERIARKGAPVSVGDTIATARASVAQIKMGDGAIVVVQPESRLTVAEYHYTGKADGSEKVRFRLEEGGVRSVTGAIGHSHPDRYLIETPIAHIGVRGTDHETYHIPASGSGKAAMAQPGTYDKVNVGATYIRTQAGEVVIGPNQVGYAASAQDTPRLLSAIPEFFNRAIEPRSAQRGGPASGSPQLASGATADQQDSQSASAGAKPGGDPQEGSAPPSGPAYQGNGLQLAASQSAVPAQQVIQTVTTTGGVNLTPAS
ncbi:MAG TPA: FecR family protein, partial [Burkholderiales bacterium]